MADATSRADLEAHRDQLADSVNRLAARLGVALGRARHDEEAVRRVRDAVAAIREDAPPEPDSLYEDDHLAQAAWGHAWNAAKSWHLKVLEAADVPPDPDRAALIVTHDGWIQAVVAAGSYYLQPGDQIIRADSRPDPAFRQAPAPGTNELGGWKPEVISIVDALRGVDWTGFDPSRLEDLGEVAAIVASILTGPAGTDGETDG